MFAKRRNLSRVYRNGGITPHGRLRLGIFQNFLPGKRAKPHRKPAPLMRFLSQLALKNTAAPLLVPLIECQPQRMRGDVLDPNFCFRPLSSSGQLPSGRISRRLLQRGSISPILKWLKDLPSGKPHPEDVFENSQKRPESIRCVIWREKVADDGLHRWSRSTGTSLPLLAHTKWSSALCMDHCENEPRSRSLHHLLRIQRQFLLLIFTQGAAQLKIPASVKSLRSDTGHD